MNCAPLFSLTNALEDPKDFFSCLAHRGRCSIHIKSSTCHHIFIILATILDPKKLLVNDVEDTLNHQNIQN